MSGEIESLPNLGPYMARRLAEIDVNDVKTLRALGAVEAYARLRFRFGREISLNALYAMDAALSGIDWRHITKQRKSELQHLVAKRTGHSMP